MHNETIVVLGGTRGIGLAVAAAARARGAEVWALARHPSLDAERIGARFARCDAAEPAAIADALGPIAKIDHLYVAAGAFVGGGVRELDLAAARAALDARVWGAAAAARLAAPKMPAGGAIVLTGGVSTDRPAPSAWATSLATAAAEQLARALALELTPIRVNAIAPGWTDTPMWDPILGAAKAETFAATAARTPIGRLVRAEEAAEAVLFLMNNKAINGEILHVDGGLRLA